MKNPLLKTLSILVIVAGINAAGSSQSGPKATSSDKNSASPNAVLYFPASQVTAGFQKSGPLLEGKDRNYTVMTARREKAGESELHERDTDVFYIVDGSATFVTGGKLTESKSIGPNEIRGAGIDGGESRQLNKGDVIIIPAGVPHWFKTVPSTFLYFVVKVRPQ